MKALLLLVLVSCALRERVDVVNPTPIYCRPISDFRQVCYDANDHPWGCVLTPATGWSCSKL